MKKIFKAFLIASLISIPLPVKADFGDADFPIGLFENSPKSYHDAWCRFIKNNCRVRFQDKAMWVEGQGGIERSQFIRYRYNSEGENSFWTATLEHYNYITYQSKNGKQREALFLFSKAQAQRDFLKAFLRWEKQSPQPIPNYRYPNSQGPQDTQGRDKGLNPYDNPPITDWSEKTTKESPPGINCNSPVYRNKPMCR